MAKCPACDGPVGEPHPPECPTCGVRLEGTTEAFAPIGGTQEETGTGVVEDGVGPVLVVHKGPDVGERFFIDRARLTVGRDPGCDIFLNDVTVSRSHAVLELAGTEVSIEDAGSLNGTYVNGVRVDKAQLDDGDVIQVGKFQMMFMNRGGS